MSSDNNNNNSGNSLPSSNDMSRSQQRRGSVTSSALSSLLRSNSLSQNQGTPFPGPLTTAALNEQRRRLSISTLGLSGTSPTSTTPFAARRASLSTNSDSIDENAVEEDDAVRTAPTTPFTRRMSFGAQAMRGMRGGTSPGNNGRPSPPLRRSSTAARARPSTPPPVSAGIGAGTGTGIGHYTWSKISSQASSANQSRPGSDMCPPSARSDQGFNWSDQLRSRAESTVTAASRSSFSFASGIGNSPPRGGGPPPAISPHHDRAKSVSDMPAPPAQAPRPRAPQKPDHFQERILKGDFYMD
ncbi:hypothetical protein B0T19DRAFT_17600 [Cercophora scortea]|uniref:Uncharacterized protein n=1 Tax=Cercophora scortea TaxID=314031 RepID=A0AAE0MKB2_9PEZI|nr:hypothetical protein B0T19DRAFT_17600 [Cercophora scortea]